MAIGADRQRQAWGTLPIDMRVAATGLLGSPVARAETQNGGFSPGSADRIVTENGRRAFIKTAIAADNQDSVELHAREAKIVAALGEALPIPLSIGVAEGAGWVVAVYEEIDGSHPATPWRANDLNAVFDAFSRIAQDPAPRELQEVLPSVADSLGTASFHDAGWAQVSAELVASFELRERIRELRAGPLGNLDLLIEEFRGDRLLHLDARADNILIRDDGSAVIVDWPHAGIGAGWVDPLSLLVDVTYVDPQAEVRALIEHPVFEGLAIETIGRFFFQLAGHFLAKSEFPEPPGIPGLRAFQREEGLVCLQLVETLAPQ